VWTNELGEGKSHTLDNIPFVLVGGDWASNGALGEVREGESQPPAALAGAWFGPSDRTSEI